MELLCAYLDNVDEREDKDWELPTNLKYLVPVTYLEYGIVVPQKGNNDLMRQPSRPGRII